MKRVYCSLLVAAMLGGSYKAGRNATNSVKPETIAAPQSRQEHNVLTLDQRPPREPISRAPGFDPQISLVEVETTLADLEFLPESKRAVIARIVRDSEMQEQEIVNSTHGFRTTRDEEGIEAVKALRDKSIRSLLTDSEWQTFQERTSSAGLELIEHLEGVQCSPEQFTFLFKAKQTLENWVTQQNPDWVDEARVMVADELGKLVEQTLGTDGRKIFERNSDPTFEHLQSFAKRFDLSAPTIGAVYDRLKAIEAIDAQQMDLVHFPNGIDPVRDAARSQAEEDLAALIPLAAFSEFASVWLMP